MVLSPAQILVMPVIDAVGKESTLIFTLSVFEQPLLSVPVTKYCVLTKGVANTAVPEAVFNPAAGNHE